MLFQIALTLLCVVLALVALYLVGAVVGLLVAILVNIKVARGASAILKRTRESFDRDFFDF